jgi:hypothetical protein
MLKTIHASVVRSTRQKETINHDEKSDIRHYSYALVFAGKTIRTLLSNWALCALEIGAIMDVIASASAAIRISVDETVVHRSTGYRHSRTVRSCHMHLKACEELNFETRLKGLKV